MERGVAMTNADNNSAFFGIMTPYFSRQLLEERGRKLPF
jgi:hypothetical protein